MEQAQLLLGAGLPELGPGPRANRFSKAELAQHLIEFIGQNRLLNSAEQLVRALALLWHDYLDESHSISQQIHNADGSFVHGIMHRREPDYSNAKYWFHRVGTHAAFPALAERVQALPVENGLSALKADLVAGGRWDPFALVDACEEAAGRGPDDPAVEFLQRVQRAEFETLLEFFCG
jgi:hypothetical protein